MHVVIIEDNQELAGNLADILRAKGISVELLPQVWDSVTRIRDQDVDLIITDILMPEFDGVAVIREVRNHRPELPIIAISGGGSKLSSNLALQFSQSFGANKILTKPFTSAELFAVIAELVPSFVWPPRRSDRH